MSVVPGLSSSPNCAASVHREKGKDWCEGSVRVCERERARERERESQREREREPEKERERETETSIVAGIQGNV